MPTWYRQGTISVTNGNATVTGIGTAWGAANTHPGDVLLAPDGKLYEILSIDSVTQLTIKPTFSNQTGYQGTTDTSGNAKYAIAPIVGSTTTADLAQRISAILTAWQDRQDELSDWQGGTVTGGDGNGYYPLTDSLGAVTHVMCPAKITSLVGDELIAAQGYATSAQSSATSAQTYASQAGTSATNAGNSASAASTSATNASNSATSASSSASTATTKASEAASSAASAASSAASAASSASSASTSATNAASSAASAAASASIVADGDKGDIVVSGSGSNWTVESVAGNLNFLGAGARITGDFMTFQTSTTNGDTLVEVIPNGAGMQGMVTCCGSADQNNTSLINMQIEQGIDTKIVSAARGSAPYLPMAFYTGGSERMRIDTSGKIGINTTTAGAQLVVAQGGNDNSAASAYPGQIQINQSAVGSLNAIGGLEFKASTSGSGYGAKIVALDEGTVVFGKRTNSADWLETLRIGIDGKATFSTSTGFGYGGWSGGTVTQATSKGTPVTLNKPSGQITTHNGALAANTAVAFVVNNSLVSITDTVSCTLVRGTGDVNAYTVTASQFAGGFYISLRNTTAGSLSQAIQIQFNVIKGAIS